MFVTSVANAANRFSVATGNWNSTATWSATSGGAGGASVPAAGDVVTIEGGFTVTVTADAACTSLTFTTTTFGTLSINSGITLAVSGAITIPRGLNPDVNTLAVGAGILNASTIAFTSSGTAVRHIMTISTGTVTVTGDITTNNNGNTSPSITFTGAGLLQVGGQLMSLTNVGGTLTTIAGCTVNYNGAGQTARVDNYLGNLTLSGSGVKTFATTPTVTGVLSMEGTATVAVTTGVVTYGTAATLQYNTSTSRTASAVEWITPFAATGGVVIANTGTITLNVNKVFNASVPLTINSGATLNTDAANNRSLSFGGDFNNGGTFTANASPITISGTMATQSIDGFTTTGLVSMTKTSGTATFQGNVNGTGLTINGTGGTLNLGTGLTHTFTGTWTRTNGTLNGGSSTLNFSLAGTVFSGTGGTFTAGTGTVNYSNAAAQTFPALTYNNLTLSGGGVKTVSTTPTVSGILSMQGTSSVTVTTGAVTFGAASTLEYAGSSAQTSTNEEFPAASGPVNLKINNASGVILHAARSIGGDLTLTNGILTTTATNLLTLNSGATTSVGSNSSYVDGPIAKAGTGAVTFPVGKSGTYRPLAISAPGAGNTLKAEYFKATPPNRTSRVAGLYKVSACEYWDLSVVSGTPTVDVTLYWNGIASPCNAAIAYIDNPASVTIAHHNSGSSSWDSYGGSGVGTNSSGSVTRTSVSIFSFFTLGSTDPNNPLPVKLSNIKAFEKQQGVQIDWTAYQEENLSRYSVERSTNGITYTSIGEIASRNSAVETNYGFFDASPVQGVNFYRLRTIDMDSKYAYSAIVKVNLDKSGKDISLYPNPSAGGYISFQGADLAKGNYTVRVYNSIGAHVMGQSFTHTGGAINQTLKLPSGIKSGMYSLQLINGDVKVMSKTFMVQ